MVISGDALVWIDLEMDGLDITKNFILEIACVVTDFSLRNIEEGPDVVVRHPHSLLKTMGQWCMEHHTKSGLFKEVLESRYSMSDAEDQILAFLDNSTEKSARLYLAGNSVYVDRYFLEKDMPRLNSRLDATILDCSSVKELIRRFNPNIANRTPMKTGQLHRALDDIRNSIEEFRYYYEEGFQENRANHQRTWPKRREVTEDLLWLQLVPKRHCILTDGNLNVIAELVDWKKSEDVIRFLRQYRVRYERMIPLAGNSLGPIRAQLRSIAPQLNDYCHYRSVDIETVSLICQRYFPNVYAQRPEYLNPNSIEDAIQLLCFYRAAIFK